MADAYKFQPPADDDHDPQAWLRWANQELVRGRNPVVRVVRHGLVDPLIELHFKSGESITVSSSALAGTRLRSIFIDFDGSAHVRHLSGPVCDLIRAALIRAAEYAEADDERSDLVLDLDTFLSRALLANDVVPLVRPDERDEAAPRAAKFRAIADFTVTNRGRSGHPAERFPVPLFWRHEAGDVELWVPRGAVATFLRAQRNWTAARQLRRLMGSLGWTPHDLHSRATGVDSGRRAKAKVWSCWLPWEPGVVDLEEVLASVIDGQFVPPVARWPL